MKWDQLLSSMDEKEFKDLEFWVTRESRTRMEKAVRLFPALNEQEKNLAINGNKIEAIKAYRFRMGETRSGSMVCGLREAKEKVEQFLDPPKDYMSCAPE